METSAGARTCIVILGMHRSGTSALARVMSLLGADLPKHVLGAAPGNPSGHWEPTELVELDNRMLREAGSNWDDWRAFDEAWIQPDRMQSYRDQVKATVDREYAGSSLFVMKLVRVARYLPVYREIIASLAIDARYTIALRNPLAVMASLADRDSMASGWAGLLWLRHVLDAELWTRGTKRAFLNYEDLMADWKRPVQHVADVLEIRWPIPIASASGAVDTFLEPDLEHHRLSFSSNANDAFPLPWVKRAYEALRVLTVEASDRAAMLSLDETRAEFDSFADSVGSAVYPEVYNRDQRLITAELARVVALERANRSEDAYRSIATSRSWRITGPVRIVTRLITGARESKL